MCRTSGGGGKARKLISAQVIHNEWRLLWWNYLELISSKDKIQLQKYGTDATEYVGTFIKDELLTLSIIKDKQ